MSWPWGLCEPFPVFKYAVCVYLLWITISSLRGAISNAAIHLNNKQLKQQYLSAFGQAKRLQPKPIPGQYILCGAYLAR